MAISSPSTLSIPSIKILRVERDLERLAAERGRHRLGGVADIGRLGGDRQLALGEREPERRVSLRELAHAARDLEQLLARQPDLVVERLRDQLPPARELALDQA